MSTSKNMGPMKSFRLISEPEAAVIACDSEAGRMLVMERDLLREMIKAKDSYILCYKIANKRPSEKLFSTLKRLDELLFSKE